jgi:hypothetical protein
VAKVLRSNRQDPLPRTAFEPQTTFVMQHSKLAHSEMAAAAFDANMERTGPLVPLQKHGLKALPKMHFLRFVYSISVIPVYLVLVVTVYSIDPTGRFFALICLQWLHMQAYVS